MTVKKTELQNKVQKAIGEKIQKWIEVIDETLTAKYRLEPVKIPLSHLPDLGLNQKELAEALDSIIKMYRGAGWDVELHDDDPDGPYLAFY